MKTSGLEILDAAELGGERMSMAMPSPIGTVEIIATSDALVEVRLTGEEWTGFHDGRASAETFPPGSAERARSGGGLLDRAVRELTAYFRGELRQFTLPVALCGTPFQEEVWRGLLAISYGERRSYGWLAERIGRSGASRAVGAANGCNPIPIVVPCHRVIGADGSLTGYGGGLETKRWLLEHEAGQGELFSST